MQEDIKPTESTARKIGAGLVVSIVLISLLVGGFAGMAGGFYAAKYMQQQGIASGSLLGKNSGAVSEDSAVIDVVKKASPAVVSIIISKDLSVAEIILKAIFISALFSLIRFSSRFRSSSRSKTAAAAQVLSIRRQAQAADSS